MRYDRQIKLNEVGVSGQEKLQKSSVLIIGVGGLGCPAAQYLAGAGIGKIGLMDHDRVSLTNLHRQTLYGEDNIGEFKAKVAKEKLQHLNSEIELVAIEEALTIENAEKIFSEYDVILDGTDNFETKYLINDACVLTGKPWVYASIYKNEAQLSVFNYKEGPSYRCLFP
ncbi:HesA/MoeB/ThiF family protein, partial [Salinimicrobium sp. CDJ15-91]|nr:HesA/MoeB/ThiF family protein [Salinimicrobium oceani]